MADDSVNERAPLVFRPSSVTAKTDNRTSFQKRLAVWSILLAVGFERLAFYSLAGNLVLFLTSNSIRWSSFHSITALLSFISKNNFYQLFIFYLFLKVLVIYQQYFFLGLVMRNSVVQKQFLSVSNHFVLCLFYFSCRICSIYWWIYIHSVVCERGYI
jgi:hypothetical protein